MEVTLTPAQSCAGEKVLQGLKSGPVSVLWSPAGMGRTTILKNIQAATDGTFVDAREFLAQLSVRHPLSIEEAFVETMRWALEEGDVTIVDDFHLVTNVLSGCGAYPRSGLFDAAAEVIMAEAAAGGKKVVFGTESWVPDAMRSRAYSWNLADFEPEDYAALCHVWLCAGQAERLDYAKIHRFASKLTAHQLKSACIWLSRRAELDTEAFIEYLRSTRLVSNVDLAEVQQVDLRDLKGIDDVIESLEANIVLPLEDGALAAELDLKPKRGILLAGPPGTGKTTIGRALAHRLKGKFFLVDGTFIAGTSQFYNRIMQVFEAAKQNSPSVIFIDDTDVIFEDTEEHGLYRYLLTMLDGLESASVGRVCVMMTAMDVGSLPPAMVRSGRIELWLETRLPDAVARGSILRERLQTLAPPLGEADAERLAEDSEGLTGADLKRVVEDGKVLFAYDKVRGLEPRPAEEYFARAIETVRANKQSYEEAERRARARKMNQR